MGVRLRSQEWEETYTTTTSRSWQVEILDDNYSSTVQDMTVTAASLSYRTKERRLFSEIIPSSASVTLEMNATETEVTNFAEDLVDTDEVRFKLKIKKDGSDYWIGFLQIDGIEFSTDPIENRPRFKIEATDGLNRLAEIPYNEDGAEYTGKETIIEHILNCVNKLDLTEYTSVMLDVAMDWEEENILGTDYLPEEIRINHKAFTRQDSTGNIISLNTLTVLRQILRRFGMRMLYSGGKYRAYQVNDYGRTAGFPETQNYLKEGTSFLGTSTNVVFEETMRTASTTSGDLVQVRGSAITYRPPVRAVVETYKHFNGEQLIGWSTFKKDETTYGGLGDRTVTQEDVKSNSGAARIFFSGVFTFSQWTVSDLNDLPVFIILRFRVKVNDYWLERTATIEDTSTTGGGFTSNNGRVTYDDDAGQWVEDATGPRYYEVAIKKTSTGLFSIPISFTTPGLPEDGNISFIVYESVVLGTDSNPVSVVYDWYCGNAVPTVAIKYEATPENAATSTEYKAEAQTAQNTKPVKFETIIGDGPNANVFGAIEILTSGGWQASGGWRVKEDAGTYEGISSLLTKEVHKAQVKPGRIWKGKFYGDYDAHDRIKYDSSYFIIQDGTIDLKTGIWSGRWQEIKFNVDVQVEEKDYQTIDPGQLDRGGDLGGLTRETDPSGGGGSYGSSDDPSVSTDTTGLQDVVVYKQTFTSASGTGPFTITENGGTLPDDIRQIFIYYGSARLFPDKDFTISGSDITIAYSLPGTQDLNVEFLIKV